MKNTEITHESSGIMIGAINHSPMQTTLRALIEVNTTKGGADKMSTGHVESGSSIGISATAQEMLDKLPDGVTIIYNSPKFPQYLDMQTVDSKEVLV